VVVSLLVGEALEVMVVVLRRSAEDVLELVLLCLFISLLVLIRDARSASGFAKRFSGGDVDLESDQNCMSNHPSVKRYHLRDEGLYRKGAWRQQICTSVCIGNRHLIFKIGL
jgi:hypothetical protein